MNLTKFCIEACYGDRVKIHTVPTFGYRLTKNEHYSDSYLRLHVGAMQCACLHVCTSILQAFKLFQYKRIVVMDADALVLKNLDHLFIEPPFTDR